MIFPRFFWATVSTLLCLSTSVLEAQVERLPRVMPASEPCPVRLASNPDAVELAVPDPLPSSFPLPFAVPDATLFPSLMSEPCPPPVAEAEADASAGARSGVFQKATFDATYIPHGGNNEPGETQLEGKLVLGFPLPTRESPLLLTPGFAVHYLDGPFTRDLPPRLFDTYVQFRWIRPVTSRLTASLSVTPGVYGDFEQQTDEAFRLTGSGVAIWDWTPTAKVLLGVAYLDRNDVRVLPIAGLIWTPSDDLKFELAMPRPRIARRLDWPGRPAGVEDWFYVAGELGGGIWAFRRTDGSDDVVNMRDFRFILGLERKAPGRLNTRFELAYVFGRKIEYDSATPDLEPADTVMIRLGASY